MSDEGTRSVRGAVEGAGRAFQVVEGGRGDGGRRPPGSETPPDKIPCPVTCLGHLDGNFHFLDARGQKRHISARGLGNHQELLSLFLGDDGWLRQEFPYKKKVKREENGAEVEIEIVTDFVIKTAAKWLMRQAAEAGLYGEHVVLRAPGVWPGTDGLPIVHCGDEILIKGKWQSAGSRTDRQIWAAAAPVPRPGLPCEAAVAQSIQEDIKQLWNFRKAGSEIAVLGLLCSGYYGAAINWRPAGFLLGGAGSGKSNLLRIIKAASPMHHYSNDTSKAGIEQAINARAMPIYVDESSDRQDQTGARALLDLVLAASGGEGTKGVRGGTDGHARTFQIAGSIIYAAISPPDMQPQHLGRFTLIELVRPDMGADNSDAHRALEERCKAHGSALWGRALGGFERYQAALAVFRSALSDDGCSPREMDQIGALLAGWWVLTQESVPAARDGIEGVSALRDFIRGAEEMVADDGPRRMVLHLMTKQVQLQRSTERRTVGGLIARVLRGSSAYSSESDGDPGPEAARNVLGGIGIRVIRATDTEPDARGRLAPRAAHGSGVWFATASTELRKLMEESVYAGERWIYELRRLESAREWKKKIRVGDVTFSSATWVSAEELGFDDDD